MSFFRRGGGGGGAAPAPQGGGAPNQPANTKQDEDKFNTYGQVRDAVESEKEIMKLLVNLGEEEFNRLMDASESYLKAKRDEQEHQRQLMALEEKKARSEHLKFAEEEHTKRQRVKQESKLRQMQIKGEEMRKLEQKKTEEFKKRVDYEQEKATQEEQKRELLRLEAKREFNRLDSERAKEQENLEQRQFQRDIELSRLKIAEEARMARENEMALAPFRLEEKIKEHNATKEDKLKRDLELKKIETEGDVKKETIKWEAVGNFFSGEEGKQRMWNVGGLVVGSLAALYFFKTVQPLAERGLKNYFFKPTLVSRSVSYHNSTIGGLYKRAKALVKPPPPMPDVILEPKLQEKLSAVIEATRNTSKRSGLYGHMMLYGKPGTGKTLFAEKLARDSNMDFAVMSGPSFDQFKASDAVVEIKNLFKWANRSQKGLLLFVDEADSFLEDRSTLDPARVTVLNEWLNQTGTESRRFMCVYETNRPEVLDPAVQSRITRSIEMTPPSTPEILRMLEQYIDLYIIKEHKLKAPERIESKEAAEQKEKEAAEGKGKEKETDEAKSFEEKEEAEGFKLVGVNDHGYHKEVEQFNLDLQSIAQRLAKEHFVGRDVSNLCIAIAQALYSDQRFELSRPLVEKVVEEQIHKKRKENIYLASRTERIAALKRFDISKHV